MTTTTTQAVSRILNTSASVNSNCIPVQYCIYGNVELLTVDAPSGWQDVKELKKKVLSFNGKNFTFTGWNSDKNEAYFKKGGYFARF